MIAGSAQSTAPVAESPVSDAERERLLKGKTFLETCAFKDCSLVNAARAAHLSPFHFHRRFTLAFGETPKDVSTRRQIEAAKILMLAGVPLHEVATESGFAHQSHFTHRFKLKTGMTPTAWKRAEEARLAPESIAD